jgi:hypothetical protein
MTGCFETGKRPEGRLPRNPLDSSPADPSRPGTCSLRPVRDGVNGVVLFLVTGVSGVSNGR